MIDALVVGTLFGQAEMRQGKNATEFAVAKVKATPDDGDTIIVNVIVFSKVACDVLMALDDGDTLALSGHITPRVWSDKQGNTRPSLDMVALQVMTAYQLTEKRETLTGIS